MNAQELNYLVEDPASVSWSIKIATLIIVFCVTLTAGFNFKISTLMEDITYATEEELQLKQTFEMEQKKASLLPEYQMQMKEMEKSFADLIKQLPDGTEIPALILDISDLGVKNGLEIELFEPLEEEEKDFYIEKPINIVANGSYDNLAGFVSDVSGLPRIVTIHNLDISPDPSLKTQQNPARSHVVLNGSSGIESNLLKMKAVIKTYRYLSDDEASANKGELGNDTLDEFN